MGPPKPAKKQAKGQKREKLFHPQSRKADQLVRASHRKHKLEVQAKARHQKQREQVDIFSFFYQCLPPEEVDHLELADVHTIIRDLWLARYDDELEAEVKARRPGRPKSVREQKLEELKLVESEEYRTGLEVLDLTHPVNVKLFRSWDQKEAAFVQQLRFIRINSDKPDMYTISRPGQHPFLKAAATSKSSEDAEMILDEDEAPLLIEPITKFSSTMMGMDEIPS